MSHFRKYFLRTFKGTFKEPHLHLRSSRSYILQSPERWHRHRFLTLYLIWRQLVVHMATLGSNQSERSKIFLDQSESRISPMWLIDVTTHCFSPRDPIGIKNTRTQELNPHCLHSFIENRAWWLDACADGVQALTLRSHVNGIVGTCADRQTTPQVPRVPMSLFPCTPTAHAQTTKSSPRPLASQKSRKTHSMEVNIHFFN